MEDRVVDLEVRKGRRPPELAVYFDKAIQEAVGLTLGQHIVVSTNVKNKEIIIKLK